MKTIKFITIILILSIATANATTVILPIPEPSLGGGGGGTSILLGTYLDQTINFKNFDMTGHASNWASSNASFNGKVFLQDGFYDSSFIFADMKQSYFGNSLNNRMLYTIMEASFYSHEGQYNLAKPATGFETSSNIFFPGIDISSSSSIISSNGTDSSFPNLFSPSYNYYVNLRVNEGIIKTMNIEAFWNTDGNRLYTRFYLGINFTGDISNVNAFTSSLQELPTEMYGSFNLVPEPATMLLLGLGGFLLRRRRK